MITQRGWWLLCLDLGLLTFGLYHQVWSMALPALTILLWFLGNWFIFTLRVRLALPSLSVERTIFGERGPIETLWARHGFRVSVRVSLSHWLGLPFVQVADLVPFGTECSFEGTSTQAGLTRQGPVDLEYGLTTGTVGAVRFEGIRICLADPQGLFYHATVIPAPCTFRVMPPLVDAEGNWPTVKRYNLLPSPGLHRYLRAGSGSELLDLRDYLPGDPPKTIAWKVSARRDRLITKVFESEVPIRCTLFLDVSQSVRVGPPGRNALGRLVEICSAVAQSASAARDLTGVSTFDDEKVHSYIRPARSSKHLVRIMQTLADSADLGPATTKAQLPILLPLGYALARRVYPYLLDPDVNKVPAWLPFLWPAPAIGAGEFSWSGRLARWLFYALAAAPLAAFAGLILSLNQPGVIEALGAIIADSAPAFLPLPPYILLTAAVGLALSLVMLYLGFLRMSRQVAVVQFQGRRRQETRWRKQLAALLAERSNRSPGELTLLMEDDAQFALALQRFLSEHHVPYPVQLYDERGKYLFASPAKIKVLARALTAAIGRGRDNELFVLLVDLLETSDALEPLLQAVKVALARHHQVLIVSPWPAGLKPPGTQPHSGADSEHPQTLIFQSTVEALNQGFRRLSLSFARLRVPVICAASGDAVSLILERINRLRHLGLGRKR